MFATLFFLALLLPLIRTVSAQYNFTINSPPVVQCQPVQINWTSTNNPPYDLFVVSASDVCGNALEDLGSYNTTSMTWTVNLAAGTEIVLYCQDNVGDEAWSNTTVVGNSNDTSCLTTANSSASGIGAAPTSSGASPAGVANAGEGPTSGALLTHPLNAGALAGTAVLAIIAFTL